MNDSTEVHTIAETVRREFERAWRDAEPRAIDDFLPDEDNPVFLPTLEELVHIDLEFAWKAGRTDRERKALPLVEEYVSRFPRLSRRDILRRLLRQEYFVRHRFGDRPAADEYGKRFPDVIDSDQEIESLQKSTPSRHDSKFAPGDRVDRYELAREHGKGGFGLVWQADDRKLGRPVALKQLNERFASQPEFRRRFITEARVSARLEHPGIVPVYDMGNIESDAPYYTMKLVRGETLDDAIRGLHEQAMTRGERAVGRLRLLNVFLSVVRTMQYCHAHGIVHRDLKPQNIILGDYGETIILDWGLAKTLETDDSPTDTVVQQAMGDDPLKTEQGTIQGTPRYMSPEQASGQTDIVDERSDIFSLGVILFQLLTGRLPFEGSNSREVLHKVCSESPPRPRAVNPQISTPLEAICLKAMAKQRDERYATVKDFATDLQRHLADEPVSAHRETTLQRGLRWCRRHRTIAATAAIAVVLLSISGSILYVQNERAAQREAERQADIRNKELRHQMELEKREAKRIAAIRRSAQANQQSALSEFRVGDLASGLVILEDTLGNLPDLAEVKDIRAELKAQCDRIDQLIRFENQADKTWFRVVVWHHSAGLRAGISLLHCQKALSELELEKHEDWWKHLPTQDLSKDQRERVAHEVHRLMLLEAWLLAMKRDLGSAEVKSQCERALEILAKAKRFRKTHFGQLVENLCHVRLGQEDRAEPLKSIEPESRADSVLFAMVYARITGIGDDADRTFLENVVRNTSGLEFTDPRSKTYEYLRDGVVLEPERYWNHMALAFYMIKEEDEFHAEMALNACLALRPDRSLTHLARGLVLIRQGRMLADDGLFEKGVRSFERAIKSTSNATEKEIIHCFRYAELYDLGKKDEAMDDALCLVKLFPATEMYKAISNLEALLGDTQVVLKQNPRNLKALATRALLLLKLEEFDKAEAEAHKLLDLAEEHSIGLAVRGTCRLRRDDTADALKDFDGALRQDEKCFWAVIGKASCLEKMNRPDDALAAFGNALSVSETNWQRIQALKGQERLLQVSGREERLSTVRRQLAAAAAALEMHDL